MGELEMVEKGMDGGGGDGVVGMVEMWMYGGGGDGEGWGGGDEDGCWMWCGSIATPDLGIGDKNYYADNRFTHQSNCSTNHEYCSSPSVDSAGGG